MDRGTTTPIHKISIAWAPLPKSVAFKCLYQGGLTCLINIDSVVTIHYLTGFLNQSHLPFPMFIPGQLADSNQGILSNFYPTPQEKESQYIAFGTWSQQMEHSFVHSRRLKYSRVLHDFVLRVYRCNPQPQVNIRNHFQRPANDFWLGAALLRPRQLTPQLVAYATQLNKGQLSILGRMGANWHNGIFWTYNCNQKNRSLGMRRASQWQSCHCQLAQN